MEEFATDLGVVGNEHVSNSGVEGDVAGACEVASEGDGVPLSVDLKNVNFLTERVRDVQLVADPVDSDGHRQPGAATDAEVGRRLSGGAARHRLAVALERHRVDALGAHVGPEERVASEVEVEAAGLRGTRHQLHRAVVRVQPPHELVVREVDLQSLVALCVASAVVRQVVAGYARARETARCVGAQLLTVAPVGALISV